jgi:hypothetical protein
MCVVCWLCWLCWLNGKKSIGLRKDHFFFLNQLSIRRRKKDTRRGKEERE